MNCRERARAVPRVAAAWRSRPPLAIRLDAGVDGDTSIATTRQDATAANPRPSRAQRSAVHATGGFGRERRAAATSALAAATAAGPDTSLIGPPAARIPYAEVLPTRPPVPRLRVAAAAGTSAPAQAPQAGSHPATHGPAARARRTRTRARDPTPPRRRTPRYAGAPAVSARCAGQVSVRDASPHRRRRRVAAESSPNWPRRHRDAAGLRQTEALRVQGADSPCPFHHDRSNARLTIT